MEMEQFAHRFIKYAIKHKAPTSVWDSAGGWYPNALQNTVATLSHDCGCKNSECQMLLKIRNAIERLGVW